VVLLTWQTVLARPHGAVPYTPTDGHSLVYDVALRQLCPCKMTLETTVNISQCRCHLTYFYYYYYEVYHYILKIYTTANNNNNNNNK